MTYPSLKIILQTTSLFQMVWGPKVPWLRSPQQCLLFKIEDIHDWDFKKLSFKIATLRMIMYIVRWNSWMKTGPRANTFNCFPPKCWPHLVITWGISTCCQIRTFLYNCFTTSSLHSFENSKNGKTSSHSHSFLPSSCHPRRKPMQGNDCGWLWSQRGQHHQPVHL